MNLDIGISEILIPLFIGLFEIFAMTQVGFKLINVDISKKRAVIIALIGAPILVLVRSLDIFHALHSLIFVIAITLITYLIFNFKPYVSFDRVKPL
ncbi:hypothetical protein [Natranaerobius thermophilus]|nr:hypothetical protein [Natranaerobius thermophilus]